MEKLETIALGEHVKTALEFMGTGGGKTKFGREARKISIINGKVHEEGLEEGQIDQYHKNFSRLLDSLAE